MKSNAQVQITFTKIKKRTAEGKNLDNPISLRKPKK